MDSKNLAKNEKNGIVYYTFPSFDECGAVKHGISTRLGGVSSGYFSTMNFSTLVGDSEECVLENYKRFCNAIEVDYKKCVASKQTHTVNIRTVTADDVGKGVIRERDYTDVDGLITNIPEITLVTHYADCVPLAFVDPNKKVIALAHSGWKGTVGKIGALTVERMVEEFGCNKKDILCGIGPSICKDCFEVDSPVSDIFLCYGDRCAVDLILCINRCCCAGHFAIDHGEVFFFCIMILYAAVQAAGDKAFGCGHAACDLFHMHTSLS